ncbi:MAG: signal peptidase I [Acidobacteria bacterium]|nr:signal peptidase I [Acidobacteriota bacterium]MBV9070703.1 signal peptidase I [Acidobacteriota bacterium]MBV9186906.1 signal peptidase I [Acidobacteriota bacterium]
MSKPSLLERLLIALAVLPFVILFGLLATGTVRTYRNLTGSMEPTIPIGDRMIAMPTGSVHRGDIIVFDYPLQQPNVAFAKRVVAVGGDTVEIRSRRLFVNGEAVAEPYAIHLDPITYPAMQTLPEPYRSRDHFGPYQAPPGTYFVLGDNRDRSSDSRYWGIVPGENLRGRVVLLFSWSSGFRRV